MDGIVCDNCSTPLPVGSKYCNECGTPVPGEGEPRSFNGFPTDLRQALQMATAGEYEIHHELGRGGMGSVFLAREIGLDRLVAVKVLPPSLMFDEGLIERFKREARMVAKLHHPNIIPVYRVHHSHNLAFYTMHFVPGRSLNELLGRNRVLSLPEVERIMLEAAAGLGYAHKRGVVHRDVKPANILIDAEGHVHLTDFGIAKALVGSTQLTETGAVIGTPQYMAPEQCEGKLVDGRADQYSLAAVGYHLLVGHPPFQSDSMKELLYHHLFTPPRPLNALRPETPLPLRDTIHKALSKDPADRFDSLEDFRMAIEGKGPPIFVPWIDAPDERRRTPPASSVPVPHPYRRATDPPTTQRLPDAPWLTEGLRNEIASGRSSVYRRTMAGLAVASTTIAVVAILAMTQGAGTGGAWLKSVTGGEDESAMSLAVNEPGAPEGPAAAGGETAQPATTEPEDGPDLGYLVVAGNLPPDARLQVPGQEIDVALTEGQQVELPTGTHEVVVRAAGFDPYRREVVVETGEEVPLNLSLVRTAPAQPRSQARVATDNRPLIPVALRDSLDALMAEARALHNVGAWWDAAEWFKEVQRSALEGVQSYRNGQELQALADSAKGDLERTRQACRLENHPNCP
ncbi:MAG: protein kinase [Gemmatimonadetes bacterium]|nr:protein kinase [Gemmatimonadota bacterium]NIO32141.1 protein kinase [Gemmatimonadota bacterium]